MRLCLWTGSASRAPPNDLSRPYQGPRMMFADELRGAIETAPRITLPAISSLLWKAFAAGQVSEAEAEGLSNLIEARKIAPAATQPVRKAVGSRPRTDASLDRRRLWAASGRLPPTLAARFTPGEQAVLAVVAAEHCRNGNCTLAVGEVANIAGVSQTLVRNALREAAQLGLVTVEERRLTAWRNDTNVVRIVSAEWTKWLEMAKGRREPKTPAPATRTASTSLSVSPQGGCRSAQGLNTVDLRPGNSGDWRGRKAAERGGSWITCEGSR